MVPSIYTQICRGAVKAKVNVTTRGRICGSGNFTATPRLYSEQRTRCHLLFFVHRFIAFATRACFITYN